MLHNSNPEADHQEVGMPWTTVTLLRRPGSLIEARATPDRGSTTPAAPHVGTSAAPAMIALQRELQLGSAANSPSTNPI
jgi:hypothetical protein